MRPQGHANVSPAAPRAHGLCDRCGFRYDHAKLSWQFEWRGTKLQNSRILVCPECIDKPQEQRRTVVLPADPVPIQNPRPDPYVNDDNPLSGLGLNIGSLRFVDAAFTMGSNKGIMSCAFANPSQVGYSNWVGKNWQGDTRLAPNIGTTLTHRISTFTATAPNNQPFLSTGPVAWQFQGSVNSFVWVTLGQGTTAGTTGEVLTSEVSETNSYQYHRLTFNGDGVHPLGIAQLALNVADGYPIEG